MVFGPTGVGKTSFAIECAKGLDGEVVSCDSQQVYKELFIGTARPTTAEMKGIPHHLIGHVSVREHYNVAIYLSDAKCAIEGILSRGKLPIVCGGSYMWLSSMIDGLSEVPKADPETRKKLEDEVEAIGVQILHKRLAELDQVSAAKIAPTDKKRIVRALEIILLSGKPRSEAFVVKNPFPYEFFCAGLAMEREKLYEMINNRVFAMIERGLLDEVRWIIEQELENDVLRVAPHGYNFMIEYITGKLGLDKAILQMQTVTRRYAKRQLTFLRGRQDFTIFGPDDANLVAKVFKEEKWMKPGPRATS